MTVLLLLGLDGTHGIAGGAELDEAARYVAHVERPTRFTTLAATASSHRRTPDGRLVPAEIPLHVREGAPNRGRPHRPRAVRLRPGARAGRARDAASGIEHDARRELLEHIVEDEERHVNWLEARKHQIQEPGYENYLAQQIRQ